jgi:hypothetical protein
VEETTALGTEYDAAVTGFTASKGTLEHNKKKRVLIKNIFKHNHDIS